METAAIEVTVCHEDISSLSVQIVPGRTLAEEVCARLCRQLRVAPVSWPLFALRLPPPRSGSGPRQPLYLPPNAPVHRNFAYHFRIRFKPADVDRLKELDLQAFNYYFYQVRNDVLDGDIPEIVYGKYRDELLGLSVADMFRVFSEGRRSLDELEKNYKRYVPKEVLKKHSIFAKKPIHQTLSRMKRTGGDPDHVKKSYLKQVNTMAPNYLSERYGVRTEMNGVEYEVTLQVMPFHGEYPGLSIRFDHKEEWEHVCTMADLCFITIGRDDESVEISRKNGIPVYVRFHDIPEKESFISVCDGYYRLMIKWTFNICKDMTSPFLERLRKIKCHGPVGGEFSYHKLEQRRKNKAGCFILRQCEQTFNTYFIDVCTKKSAKPETYKIEEDEGSFTLYDRTGKRYSSLPELIAAHKNPDQRIYLGECLPPSEYDAELLESQLLLCQNSGLASKRKIDEVDLENLLGKDKSPRCIHTKNLVVFPNSRIEGAEKVSVMYKAEWNVSNNKKLTVAMKMLKADASDLHMKEFIHKAGQWAFLQCSAIVKLFGVTLHSPVAMIMEYVPYGSLDKYLMGDNKMEVEDLVEAASSLAAALFHLAENNVVHGNIRCHKLLVAGHDDSHFSVKLSDPGLHFSYSEDEVHWIPVEFFENFEYARISPLADVWAFGTTLWEIFSYPDQTTKVNEIYRTFTKKVYCNGGRLRQPTKCPDEIYQIMCSCWKVDITQRARPHDIIRDVKRVFYQEFNSRKKHAYSVIAPRLLKGSLSSFHSNITSETSIDTNIQSATDLDQDDSNRSIVSFVSDDQTMITEFDIEDSVSCNLSIMNMMPHSIDTMQSIFELGADYNVILQGKIGQGFYGEVFKGMLERNDNSDSKQVAVKKLKTLDQHQDETLRKDFRREMAIMQKLNHPNIVKILWMIEDPEMQLVMEYVQHGCLERYLKINKEKKNITVKQILKYALDVSEGMAYLGNQNIVHRDLAARNILVADENLVKISDFGLAQFVNTGGYYISKTQRDIPIKWYAPESVSHGKFSSRSDVWSFGVTIWEMFSFGEQPPSWGPNSTSNLPSKLPCPESCPTEIYSRLMLVCWQLAPADRPTFIQLVNTCKDLMQQY